MVSGSSGKLLKKPALQGALVPVYSTVTAGELQSICWPGLMNISGGSAVWSAACSTRSIQKLPKSYLSTSLVPAVQAATSKIFQEKSPEWNPHRLAGWWSPREKWMSDIGSFQWKLPVQKRSRASKRNPWLHQPLTVQGAWVPEIEDEFSKNGILQWWKESLQISEKTASFRIRGHKATAFGAVFRLQ